MRWVEPVRSTVVSGSPDRVPPQDGGGNGEGGDTVMDRIAKYIPGEILAIFTSLFTLMVSLKLEEGQGPKLAALLILFFLGVTIVYISRNAPAGIVRKSHLFISSLAFLAWSYPICSSVLGDWFNPVVAFLLQAVVLGLSVIPPKAA